MKICSSCKLTLDLAGFNLNSLKSDGRQGICRQCSNEYSRNRYKNSEAEKLRAAQNRNKHREKVRSFIREKKDLPCADCKQNYPYYVMDFDHLSDKSFQLGSALSTPISLIKKKLKSVK